MTPRPSYQKASNEEIVSAYRTYGSVWKAAKHLGICGQSVWERLKALGYSLPSRAWTQEEIEELKSLASQMPISKIAERLARPYSGVAIKLSRLGYATRFGNRQKRKHNRRVFTEEQIDSVIEKLKASGVSLRKFCRKHGFYIDTLVYSLQSLRPLFWKSYSATVAVLPQRVCAHCGSDFWPLTKKQNSCTRLCGDATRRNQKYFGGKRNQANGLVEKICMLCQEQVKTHLSAHHILGKEHDPDNEYLDALCRSCHQIVGILAGKKCMDNRDSWERLIQYVMLRRLHSVSPASVAVSVCVDMEYINSSQYEEIFQE